MLICFGVEVGSRLEEVGLSWGILRSLLGCGVLPLLDQLIPAFLSCQGVGGTVRVSDEITATMFIVFLW